MSRRKSHSSCVFLMGSLHCIAGCVPIESTWVSTTLVGWKKERYSQKRKLKIFSEERRIQFRRERKREI